MPTADRRAFVGQAIRYFMRQDYPNRELIVIDDGADAVADLMPAGAMIRYIRLPTRQSVGAKRNLACEEARGEIVVHFDDDDWSAPWRLSYQVTSLVREEADICGLSRVFYYDPWRRQAWQYVYPESARAWVAGNTLCYPKAVWHRSPFPQVDVGEDTRFVWAGSARHIKSLADPNFFVATIHPTNVSLKRPGGSRWRPVAAEDVESLLGDELQFYSQLRSS
jgi:glycosyltransferase involved in cell wall biosynthesis